MPLSKHCDWLEIVPLVVHAGSRMYALWERALYVGFFSNFFTILEKTVFEQSRGYNREIVRLIFRENLECDMKFNYNSS